ncbi:MAG: transcriptional regulator, Crp/Fnr family [Bryobacterales bacterium]|nr:transcriptional regulator, Crp/Fnr family [Bryobacterales bacterium]
MSDVQPKPSTKGLEDPLDYLPCSKIVECGKGRIIYGPGSPSANLYVIIGGMIGVERIGGDGSKVLVEIYKTDELIGESALIGMYDTRENAVAFDDAKLMIWTRTDVEALVLRQPRLGVALLQTFAQRTIELAERIESFSFEQIEHRLARSLIHFSKRFGRIQEDGSIGMMPITHELLARYIGTSREQVTQRMNAFRRLGYVHYSRTGFLLYPDALRKAIGAGVKAAQV